MKSDLTINERLAIIETKMEHIEESLMKDISNLNKTVSLISADLTKYKGFVGGIVFVFSSLSVFFYKMAAPIIEALKVK